MEFVSNAARDASSSIAGYVYQVDVTISCWLNLQPNELLELERGEDLDAVRVSDNHSEDLRTLQQIKATGTSLTLRSTNALTALANFCEHRRLNPGHHLKFRYITTSPVGREKDWKPKSAAIELWESVRTGELAGDDASDAVSAIRGFLKGCKKPNGVQGSTWNVLADALAEQNLQEFREIIRSFEWSTASGDAASLEADIKRALVQSAFASDEEHAETLFECLFLYVFKRLTKSGLKRLTADELREQLKHPALSVDDHGFLVEIRVLARRVDSLEREVAQDRSILQSLSEQVQMIAGAHKAEFEYRPAQVSLDIPAPAVPAITRDRIVNQINDQANRKTWASIIGEPGCGKTQLCLLFTDRVDSRIVWINLRGFTDERSCAAIDDALETASGVERHAILQRWYADAARRLNPPTTLVLDDLPRVVVGGALYHRLQFLQGACHESRLKMLSTTYFELPRIFLESGIVSEVSAPPFTPEEILDLLRANGAPARIATSEFAAFLATSTRGLPVIVVAAIRFLVSTNWVPKTGSLDSLLKGEYAAGAKRDAKQIIETTVTDSGTCELLYRLTCVVGPISRQQVETVGKVPSKIDLCIEKLSQLVGIWVQPYGENAYLLSPLVDSNLANLLDSNTRKGVHIALALLALRKPLSTVDVIVCVHHFHSAEQDNAASIVLLQALVKIMDYAAEVPNEWMVSSLWAHQSLPETVDINLRLNLRALQIALAERRKKDYSFLSDDLRQLLSQAKSDGKAQLGVFMASSLLATQLYRKNPSLANNYILMALRSSLKAVLPNGKQLVLPKEMALERTLWGTGMAAKSDEEVQNWLDTLAQLSPAQVEVLSDSEFADDDSTVICDSVWLREYQKPENERNWQPVEKTLRQIKEQANKLGLNLLSAAATRTEIMILAEWRDQLPEALSLAETAVESFRDDSARFLIEEVTGRQLAYAGRWEEALQWMGQALQRHTKGSAPWRRNLLVTVGEGVARYAPAVAAEYAGYAVLVSKSANLAPVRVAEALGEYAIALWNAGEHEKAFAQWQDAIPLIISSVDQPPSDIQVFLAFLHATAYFGNMAIFARPPKNDYAVPAPGFFLATNRIPSEMYQLTKNNHLLIETALFAEGVGQTEAAGEWARLALDGTSGEGSDVLQPFIWLTVAPALLGDEYVDALNRARSMATPTAAPSEQSLEELGIQPQDRLRLRTILSDQRRIELALLFGFVPLAVRLATVRFDHDVSTEIGKIKTHLDSLSGKDAESWKEAGTLLKSILSDAGQSARSLHERASQCYSENHAALGVLCLLGSILLAPERQSLATQVSLARDLEKLFGTNPSIRYKILLPFFENYWESVTTSGTAIFRTAASYTRRSLDEARTHPVQTRLKAVFKSMVFCIGLSLPSDLKDWIDE